MPGKYNDSSIANSICLAIGSQLSCRYTSCLVCLIFALTTLAVQNGVVDTTHKTHVLNPYDTRPNIHIDTLHADLRAGLRVLERKYRPELLERHSVVGAGFEAIVGKLVLRSLEPNDDLHENTIVIGVTGGSSSCTRDAWPRLLAARLADQLGPSRIQLRNAAMGTTSQLITAPCIHTLVGDAVDILFWEFAMNDEYHMSNGAENAGSLRTRVADAYIRQAIALDPPAIGFVHFWDLRVHLYQTVETHLPDRSFEPTCTVMRYYDSIYDRYFAVNVIGFMSESGLYRNKTEFLRDGHHPNRFGYDVAVDMITYCIYKAAIASIKKLSLTSNDVDHRHGRLKTTILPDYPLLTTHKEQSQYGLPGQRLFGHCLMAAKPNFGHSTGIRVMQNVSLFNAGNADLTREDRDLRFVIGACGTSRELVLSIHVPNIAYVIIGCGQGNSIKCRNLLRVELEDVGVITPNVDVSADVMEQFVGWVHKTTVLQASGRPRRMSLCSTANESDVQVSRIIVMQHMPSI